MTREEEIHNAAMEVSKRWRREEQPTQDVIIAYDAAVTMAKWADSHPREGLWDAEKVEKVLGNLLFNKEEKIYRAYLDYDAFFEDLRKAMEE